MFKDNATIKRMIRRRIVVLEAKAAIAPTIIVVIEESAR